MDVRSHEINMLKVYAVDIQQHDSELERRALITSAYIVNCIPTVCLLAVCFVSIANSFT